MSPESAAWAVVLEEDSSLPVLDLSRPIAQAIRRPVADVSRALGRCRGLIDLDLTRDQARKVADILSSRSCRSRLALARDVPAPPKPRMLCDADPTPHGLVVQRVAGMDPHCLRWSDVELIAVGVVTFTFPARLRDPGEAPPEIGGLQGATLLGTLFGDGYHRNQRPTAREIFATGRARKQKSETVLLLDLLRRNPGDRYRVASGRFVYDYLGERLELSSARNFRKLVTDIAMLAPDVFLSGTAISWLEHPRSRHHRFKHPEEFDAYVRWLLAYNQVWSSA